MVEEMLALACTALVAGVLALIGLFDDDEP